MANVRDTILDIGNDLVAFAGALPQGNWQQVAVNLAAPGQQQILQQQQQILQQLQQQQHSLQAIPQIQATLQQMDARLQNIEEDLGGVMWTQRNAAFRASNHRDPEHLQPLYKEHHGGVLLIGTLPPADVPFPNTDAKVWVLKGPQLNQLQDFYQVQFAGNNIGARRAAFWRYISSP